MSYNWTAVVTVKDFLMLPNEGTSGWFWYAMLVMAFVIITMAMIGWGIEVAMLMSSTLTFVISMLMAYGGFVPWWYTLQFFAFILITIIYIFVSSRVDNQ